MSERSVNILFLHTPVTFGGTEIFIGKLAVGLKQHGFNSILMVRRRVLRALGGGRLIPQIPLGLPGINKTFNPLRWLFFSAVLALSIIKVGTVIKKYRVNLIAVNSWDSFLFSLMSAKLFKIPIVYHAHGALKPHSFTRAFCRYLVAPNVDLVIAVSDMIRDHYVAHLGFDDRRIQRIYNGVEIKTADTNRARPQPPRIVVGTVTRIEPEKGVHIFIDAAKTIVARRPEVEFWIVGDVTKSSDRSYKNELEGKIKAGGVADKIKFLGWRDDVEELLGQMDIFVLTTIEREGLPLAILEAMMLAKPVIATRIGGIPEVITDNRTGMLLPPGNAAAVVTAVLALIDDPARRRRIAIAGRRRVEKDFSQERFLSEIKTAYRRILQSS